MKNMKLKNPKPLCIALSLFSLITISTILLGLYLRTTPNNTTQLTTNGIATPTSSTSCFKPSVKLIDEGKYIKLEIKDDYSINRTLYSQHLMIINSSVFLKFNGNEFTLQVILRVGKSSLANLVARQSQLAPADASLKINKSIILHAHVEMF